MVPVLATFVIHHKIEVDDEGSQHGGVWAWMGPGRMAAIACPQHLGTFRGLGLLEGKIDREQRG
jgi:hypothetical protein